MPDYGLKFLCGFLAHPAAVGSVFPSSKALASATARAAGVADASVVVELGPGTGAITEAILAQLDEDAVFFAIERDAGFVKVLRKRFPDLTVYHDSAKNIGKHLDERGLEACDSIVSGLPWASFHEDIQDTLLDAILDALQPGGRFATYAYINNYPLPSAKRIRKKFQDHFSEFSIGQPVWKNVPPAIIYSCRK